MSKLCITLLSVFFLIPASVFGQGARTGSKSGGAAKDDKPTVYLAPIEKRELYRTVEYGGRVEPLNLFPQPSTIDGVVRNIYVKVGQKVVVGQPLFSVQKMVPGTAFLAGSVNSLNAGEVVRIPFGVGEQIKTNGDSIMVADVSKYKISFYLSDKDIDSIMKHREVYLSSVQQAATNERTTITADSKMADADKKASLAYIDAMVKRNTGYIDELPLVPDYTTGLFSVRAIFDTTADLSLGKFERVELHVDNYSGAAIDQSRIVKRYGQSNVMVVEEGKAVYKTMVPGGTYGDSVAIVGGLEVGDQIIVGSSRGYIPPGTEVLSISNAERLAARNKER